MAIRLMRYGLKAPLTCAVAVHLDYAFVGRFRIRNFCMPSSTSSRRWLNTVERRVTTPVVRPGYSSVTSSAG